MTNKIITIDPEISYVKIVFDGVSVPVKNLIDRPASGKTIETFLEDVESVSRPEANSMLELSENFLDTSAEIFNENFDSLRDKM